MSTGDIIMWSFLLSLDMFVLGLLIGQTFLVGP